MSKASMVSEKVESVSNGSSKRQKILTQYIRADGNTYRASGDVDTVGVLEAGIYKVKSTMRGIFFEVHDVKTDELLKFEDSRYNEVLDEIDKFWGLKERFDKLGFTHKRGMLLYGSPGTGKSCLLKQVMDSCVESGNIVLVTRSGSALRDGMKELREVEPERKILVIFEDIDEILKYGDEHSILELFDGDDQVDNVLYLATTNYIDKLPPRMLREGRFDRKVEVFNPPKAGRLAYLRHKLGVNEDEKVIEDLADKTKGFSFAQLREFLVGSYCLGKSPNSVIERIKNGLENTPVTEDELKVKLAESLLKTRAERITALL